MSKQSLPPPGFEHPSPGQQITTGWFGAQDGGNAGHTGYPEASWGIKSQPQTPRRRSNSIKKSSMKSANLQRSTSWGHAEGAAHGFGNHGGASGYPYASNVPPYARGDIFDERNLAKRPLDWRPDFKASLASYFPGLGKSRSEVAGAFSRFPRWFSVLIFNFRLG